VARIAASDLRSLGFQVVDVSKAEQDHPTTVVRHDPRFDRSAASVATALRGAPLEAEPGQGRTVRIILGQDYTGVDEIVLRRPGSTEGPTAGPQKAATTAPDPALESRRADADICS
jgi:hypothetical protein